VIFGKQPLV